MGKEEVTRLSVEGSFIPLLLCMEVDSFFDLLLPENYYNQGYADEVVVLIPGREYSGESYEENSIANTGQIWQGEPKDKPELGDTDYKKIY